MELLWTLLLGCSN